MTTIEYLARCHCGALTARYQTAVEPSVWAMRACQCSFCRSHGALATSDPAGQLTFQSSDPARIQRYRFGGRAAAFLICRECGVYVGVQIATDKGRFGVLNVLSLRPLIKNLPAAEPMDYGAETPEVRRLRRESRWTPLSAESI
ncbi:MAG: GFA family protein [Steroidobacteraceae bacterium]